MPDDFKDTNSPTTKKSETDEVIELEAVEIPRQRQSIHDIPDGGDFSQDYRTPPPSQSRPEVIFKTAQNSGCNCCMLWLVLGFIAIVSLF